MKIAICFSSQIRTGVHVAKNIKNYIGDLYQYCDFFVHTWDIETLSQNDLNTSNQDREIYDRDKNKPILVNKSVFNEFYSLYNPISMVVEPYFLSENEPFQGGIRYNKTINGYVLSLFESIYECNLLKKKHEDKFQFKYDYIIRMRPDLVIHPEKKLEYDLKELVSDDVILYAGHKRRDYNSNVWIEDIFWISKSEIIDKISNFYEYETKGNFNRNDLYYDWQKIMNNWVINDLNITPMVLKNSTMCPYYISDLKIDADIMGTEIYTRQY